MRRRHGKLLALCLTAGVLALATGGGYSARVQAFSDVGGHWAEPYVKALQQAAVALGDADGRFWPDRPVTRAEVVTMLARAAGPTATGEPGASPPGYADWAAVPDWARPAVWWSSSAGILRGYPDGTLRALAPVTRVELAVILARATGYSPAAANQGVLAGFVDGDTIPDWARGETAWVVASGLMRGRDGARFAPEASATRAEAAAVTAHAINQAKLGRPVAAAPPAGDAAGADQAASRPAGDQAATPAAPEQPPASPTAPQPPAGGQRYRVLGYYPVDWPGDRTAYNSLAANPPVDEVAAFLYAIDAQGRVSGQADAGLMTLAKQRGIKVYALIHNFNSGNFDRYAAGQVLTNPTVRSRALDAIVSVVRNQGYDGVHIDLENVDPAQRRALTSFMQDLADVLRPTGHHVSIAVPAKTGDDPGHGWSGAFDYAALGRIVDHLAIMTYDEHWIGQGPGPVASIGWVEQVVRYAVTVVPRNKIYLGIAAYGYDWPAAGGWGAMIKAAEAPALAARHGVRVQWDDRAQVPFFHYTSGGQARTVYYENRQSTSFKLRLVSEHRLAGIAIWRLGTEDPEIWPLIRSHRGY